MLRILSLDPGLLRWELGGLGSSPKCLGSGPVRWCAPAWLPPSMFTLLGQTVATAQNGAQSRPASPARKGRRGQKGGAHGHLTPAALGLGLDQRFGIPREQRKQDGNHKERAEEAEGNFPGLEDPSFYPEMAHLSCPEEAHLGHFPGELSHTGNKERIQKPPERELFPHRELRIQLASSFSTAQELEGEATEPSQWCKNSLPSIPSRTAH